MEYYIYGAGKNINTVLEQTTTPLNVFGVLDNDASKIGMEIGGIKVELADKFIKEKFNKEKHRIIVSVTQPIARREIEEELVKIGLQKGKEFVMAGDICLFSSEQIPGAVTGVVKVPDGYVARKSCDPNSYLVKSKENRLFRIIKPEGAKKTKNIYARCKENCIFGRYLINSWFPEDITDFENEIVLEHEYIQPITYCYEWPPKMYSEYVEFMLNFLTELTKAGLRLSDPHGLNATVHEGKFIFLDFGAIDEGVALPREIIELTNTLIFPLILMRKGQIKRAYLYLEEHELPMGIRDIWGYLTDKEIKRLSETYERLIHAYTKEEVLENLINLKKLIDEFGQKEKNCIWGDYQEDEWKRADDRNLWTTKMKNVETMIKDVKPKSIVDIAGNQGWYGSCCRDIVDRAIVVDMDMDALDRLWNRIKNDDMRNVIPMKMSICAPSLGRHYDGLIDGNTIKPLRECGCKRIKSEMAIALAIVHHLAFREHLSFEEIIRLLMSYTERYLIIEYVEQTDQFINNFIKVGYEWYTKDKFEECLKKYFEILKVERSMPEETRTLYLCEKR